MTFPNTLVNVPTAPPGQTEKGAVSRITQPKAATPMSSGVKRVTARPRPSRPVIIAPSPKIAVSSASGTLPRPGIWSCGRK